MIILTMRMFILGMMMIIPAMMMIILAMMMMLAKGAMRCATLGAGRGMWHSERWHSFLEYHPRYTHYTPTTTNWFSVIDDTKQPYNSFLEYHPHHPRYTRHNQLVLRH